MSNILKTALINKYRFDHITGKISAEQLFDLNLANLDKIGMGLQKEIKELSDGTDSLLSSSRGSNPKVSELTNKLDIVKMVIAHKEEAAERATKAAETRDKKAKAQAILDARKESAMESYTDEQLAAVLRGEDPELYAPKVRESTGISADLK